MGHKSIIWICLSLKHPIDIRLNHLCAQKLGFTDFSFPLRCTFIVILNTLGKEYLIQNRPKEIQISLLFSILFIDAFYIIIGIKELLKKGV